MTLSATTIDHLNDLTKRYPTLLPLEDAVRESVEIIRRSYMAGGKLLICGNGGSAADSEHIVGELMKSFVLPRKLTSADMERLEVAGCADCKDLANKLQRGVPAISLSGHPALSSAVANDGDPAMVFAQQVFVLGRPGDVLMGLSTSGNAKNVVNALKVGKAFGLNTIALTGAGHSVADSLCDVVIKAPATETFMVQEYHLPIYHAICLMVEQELFGQEVSDTTNNDRRVAHNG